MGVRTTFRNSTSEPSACRAICPRVAVQLVPRLTNWSFTHTLMVSATHSGSVTFCVSRDLGFSIVVSCWMSSDI